MARQVLENGVVLPAEYSDDWYDDMTSNLTKLDDVIGSDSEKLSSADVGAAALSNNYNDLDNLPTIPTVNDAVLTIQKNGVDVQTFTANASSNVTANITVPTKTSDLTNDSNFVDTSNSAVASGITSAKVTDYDTHIADTDIHVTTADKNRWNNGVTQSYVFRYSSTALVASSTNANSLLDNTDNLKVGDKVIDSSGVLFSITAIDTANSTFTIGLALIDLALDANVVHTSGNETINGVKNFSDNISTKKIISNVAQLQINAKSNADSVAVIAGDSASEGGGIWLYGKNSGSGSDCRLQIYNTSQSRYERVDLVGSQFLPLPSGEIDCGGTSNKWKTFNGLEPSSLSLPSGNANDVIDISSYITALDGTDNTYIAPANGWITINMNNCLGIHATITGFWSDSRVRASAGAIKFLMPVLKNQTVTLTIHNGTINNARFIPCQGNV